MLSWLNELAQTNDTGTDCEKLKEDRARELGRRVAGYSNDVGERQDKEDRGH